MNSISLFELRKGATFGADKRRETFIVRGLSPGDLVVPSSWKNCGSCKTTRRADKVGSREHQEDVQGEHVTKLLVVCQHPTEHPTKSRTKLLN